MPSLEEQFKSVPPERLQYIATQVKQGKIDDPEKFRDEFKQLPIPVAEAFTQELQAKASTTTNQREKELAQLQETVEQGTIVGKAKSFGKDVLQGAVEVGEAIDKYTGAPTRSALRAGIRGENPLKAAYKQVGQESRLAPTGKEIASEDLGLSEEESIHLPWIGNISPAGAAGLAIDIGADWSNFIPAGAINKVTKGVVSTLGKGLAEGTKLGSKAIAKTIDFFTNEKYATKTLEAASGAVENAIDVIAKKLKPGLAPDIIEMQKIATKNGLDFELTKPFMEFPKDSLITKATKVQAQGTLGEPLLARHANGVKQVNKAIAQKAEHLSGGKIHTPFETGELIKESLEKNKRELFNQIDFTYRSVAEQLPGMNLKDVSAGAQQKLSRKLNSTIRDLSEFLESAPTAESVRQTKEVLNTAERMKMANGDFETIVKQIRAIGEVAFKKKGTSLINPPDIQGLRELYFAGQEALIEATAKAMGDDVAMKLINNNRIISNYFSDRGLLKGIEDLSSEKVFQRFIQNGDVAQIDAIKRLTDKDTMNAARGALIDSFIKEDIEGKFTFKSLFNKMRDKEQLLKQLFEPEELNDLTDIIRYGDRMGAPILNVSGTDVSRSFRELISDLPVQLTNEQLLESLKRMAREQSNVTRGIKASEETLSKTKGYQKVLESLKPTQRQSVVKGFQVLSPQAESEDNPINRALKARR